MVIYGGKTCKDGVKVGKNRVILNFMTYGCVIAHFDIINEYNKNIYPGYF